MSLDQPSEEQLRKLYWGDGLTQEEIGDELDVSHATVSNWMKHYGIETRTGRRQESALEHPVRLSKQTRALLREYANEHDLTYDGALREVLPEDVEANVLNQEEVYIEVSGESHERLSELAGKGYSHSDVVEHFLRETFGGIHE